MKLTCAPFWRLSCFIRKIKRLRSILMRVAALGYSLIAFFDLFRWLVFEEAFIKAMKLSVSILEADGLHLFHLQLCFFSQCNTRIEVYAVYRWAVAFFCFFDLFCWSVRITSIRGMDGWWMVDPQKIRPVVRYMLRFNKPISSLFTLTRINPKNQHFNQKMT